MTIVNYFLLQLKALLRKAILSHSVMYLLYCSELNYTYIEFIHKALGESVNHIPMDKK